MSSSLFLPVVKAALFLLLSTLAGPALAAADGALPVRAAGCIVRIQESLLLVKDVWSYRWSLPGGGAEAGEAPAQVAEREVWEEIGLSVRAGAPLGQLGGFAMFACAPQSGHLEVLQRGVLLLPDAARMEVAEARLVPLGELAQLPWRFPQQAAAVTELARATTPLPGSWLRPAQTSIGPLFAAELAGIRRLQAVPGAAWDSAMHLASQLGDARQLFWVVLFIWSLVGWRAGAELLLLAAVIGLLGCLLKQGFTLPRPIYLDPSLQRQAASGFGFPSGHTVIATTWLTFLARRSGRPGAWGVAVPLCFLCGLGRAYLGAHFFHDLIGGWLLAGGMTWLHGRLTAGRTQPYLPLRMWALVGGLLAALTLTVQLQPSPFIFTLSGLGLLLGLALFYRGQAPVPVGGPWRLLPGAAPLQQLLLGAFLAFLCNRGTAFLRPVEADFPACLAFFALRYGSLGLVLPVSGWLHRRLCGARLAPACRPSVSAI